MEIHLTVGKSSDNDIVYEHPTVSGRHLELTYTGGDRLYLRDLDSTNGTWVNDREVINSSITRRDQIRLGELRIETHDLFGQADKFYNKGKTDYTKEFAALKPHFMAFERQQRRVRSKSSLMPNLIRGGVTLAIMMLVMLVVEDQNIRYPLMIGAGVLGGIVVAMRPGNNTAEKINLLRAEYEAKLRCPSCDLNLSREFYSAWKTRGKCPKCEAAWIHKKRKQ